MTIYETVNENLKQAMLARDAARTGALRLVLAELKKKWKETGNLPTDDEARALMQSMARKCQDTLAEVAGKGRQDLEDAANAELAVIRGFLPPMVTAEEMKAAVSAAAAEAGANPNAGKLVGAVIKKLKETGKTFDGGDVKKAVEEFLKK